MSEEKAKILENIGKSIDKMDSSQLSYMIGFGEGLAMSKGLAPEKKEGEEDGKEEDQPG